MQVAASTIGKRIKAVRTRAGLPQDRFASALGYSKRALINWEHDAAEPPIGILPKLRNIFDVDPEWVVMGEDTTPQSIYKQIDRERWARMSRDVDRVCVDVGLDLTADQRVGLVRSMYEDPSSADAENATRLRRTLRALSLDR